MSALIFVKPIPFLTTLASGRDPTEANLNTPNPKEAYFAPSTALQFFVADMGSAQSVDTGFLGYTNAKDGVVVEFRVGNDPGGTGAVSLGAHVVARDGSARPYHALVKGATLVGRYLFCIVTGTDPVKLIAGVLAGGKALQPTFGHEWGAGRRVLDTGAKERLKSGGFGVDRGVRASAWQWTLGDLTDAEADALNELALDVGETSSVLVVEDPDQTAGLSKRCHWGMFTGLEAFERIAPGATRWAWKVEDWA